MKKLIKILTVLFATHTLEEEVTSFWKTDWSVQVASKALSLDPAIFYWLTQTILYVFLLTLIFLPLKKAGRFLYPIVGVLLVLEFQHLWVAISAGMYTSGVYTGTLLALFSIYFWGVYTRLNYKK